jgi:SAM-dependent methyltransferase
VTKDPGWEEEAEHWVAWSRTPGHDAYWYFRDAFFDEVVPSPGGLTAEIGCGEGRVSRDLRRRGHTTVSVDLSPTLLAYAQEGDPDGLFIRADAVSLPLSSGCREIVVAYNSLMDIWDMQGAVAEAGRVLAPGGSFCVCVPHPVRDSGLLDAGRGTVLESPGRPVYFGRRDFDTTIARDGLTIRFRGWSYPLEDYVRSLERAGLVIDLLREPKPSAGTLRDTGWHDFPLFLMLRARKLDRGNPAAPRR